MFNVRAAHTSLRERFCSPFCSCCVIPYNRRHFTRPLKAVFDYIDSTVKLETGKDTSHGEGMFVCGRSVGCMKL